MKYGQLTYEQRYQIYAYSKADWTKKGIARELGVHRSTIYREVKRNKGLRGYRPQQANRMAQARKRSARKMPNDDREVCVEKSERLSKLRSASSPKILRENIRGILLLCATFC